MGIVYGIIHWIIQLFILVVIAQAILSYFVDPYHPVRRTIDKIVNPFLNPIRRVVPLLGNLDFSPLVLIILLQVLDSILYRLL
jgi:YggT family protein